MSIERVLGIVDCLLKVLDKAEESQKSDHAHGTCHKEHTAPTQPFEYISSLEDVEEGHIIQITMDIELLRSKWKEVGLSENDELPGYCGHIGKVTEVESSDDTLQVQWENYDTCWVPAFACGRAPSGAKPTIPGTNNSWLNDSKAVGSEFDEELKRDEEEKGEERLLASAEDPAAQTGNRLRITKNLTVLEDKWKSSELSKQDLHQYLGAVGAVVQVTEDFDTVELKWGDDKTTWVPVQACMEAQDADLTIPQ